jgi:hypothetical protein
MPFTVGYVLGVATPILIVWALALQSRIKAAKRGPSTLEY